MRKEEARDGIAILIEVVLDEGLVDGVEEIGSPGGQVAGGAEDLFHLLEIRAKGFKVIRTFVEGGLLCLYGRVREGGLVRIRDAFEILDGLDNELCEELKGGEWREETERR